MAEDKTVAVDLTQAEIDYLLGNTDWSYREAPEALMNKLKDARGDEPIPE